MIRRIPWHYVALGVALAVGAYFRFWRLTDQSLFLDEGFSFMVAGKPWPDFINQIVYHDFHPPLFYLLTRFALQWHWQLWDYRYLTAPFGLLTIVATWGIARKLFGNVAAAIAAIVIALEPALVDWDRIFRMYSVLTALATLSWWLLLIAREQHGRRRIACWLAYGLIAVVLPYVHYLGAITVICQCLYALTDVKRLWPVLAGGGAAVAALVPWAWAIRIQYPHGGYVAGTTTIPIIWRTLALDVFAAGVPIGWATSLALPWTATLIAFGLFAFAVLRAPRTALPFWIGVALVQVAATLVTHKGLVVPRYLLTVVPAFAVALGGAVAWLLTTRARIVGAVAAVAVPAFFLVCCADIVYDPYYQFTDWYLVNLVVLQNEHADDAMLFVQGFPYIVVGDFTAFRNREVAGPALPSDVPAAIDWIKRHRSVRIWYIENQFFYPDPQKHIKQYLDQTRRPVTLANGRPAIWSEARSSPADMVNIILYNTPASGARKTGRMDEPPRTSAAGSLTAGRTGHCK